jgi:hypothetical protein
MMFDSIKEKYREQGRQEVWELFIEKFEDLHEQYYAQGDDVAAELATDLVAWLQDDWEAVSDRFPFQ